MSCQVKYNKDNTIKTVFDQNGNESVLFNQIATLPHVKSKEAALEIYKQTLKNFDTKDKNNTFEKNKQDDRRLSETPEQRRRRRERWDDRRGDQTLEGAPKYKRSKGAIAELVSIAEEYAEQRGIDYKRQSKYVEVDAERAIRIAEAYENMEHNPQDEVVKEAYQNLIKQTKEQYDMLVEAGYEFYFFDETNDPYEGKPVRAMIELRENRRMGSFTTESGFGSQATDLDVSDNPMLEDTGLQWGFGSVDGKKKRVLANDLFRVVHDAFGHGLEGAGFRARGEENAWQAHARLFTGSAVAAITSETRGQNSWLNFGIYAEQNKTASVEDTIFADQKVGLMPEWTWKEGYDEGVTLSTEAENNLETPLQFKTNNKTFDTYKESLQEGSDIEVGIETKDGFKPLMKIPYNVNPNTLDGFINKYIKEDILKGEKIEYLGKTYYKPDGVDYIHERINEHIVKEDLNAMHGSASVKAKDGLIEIIEPQKKESLDENHLKILKGLSEEFTRKLDNPKVSIRPQLSSDDLQLKLLNVLNKLGVETLSISNYIEKYKIKHGVEPSATALADIANRVVAFKDGNLRLEDLTEETMSFIIEALDPKVTENLLRNITQSEEYAQFSEQYREVYGKESPNLTSEELENKVRKEVLSKIMKNATLRLQSTPSQQNFYQKAIEFIRNFFDKISSTNYRQELSLINDMVEDMFIRDNISDYIDSDNITSSFRFYNLGTQGQSDPRLDKMKVLNKALLEQIEQSIISAKRGGASLADTVVKLKTYKSRNEELLRGEAALNFSRMTKNLINFVKAELESAKEQDTVLTLEARDVLSNLKGNIRELLNAIKESSKPLSAHQIGIVSDTATTAEATKAKDLFEETLKEITEEINSISGSHKLQEDKVFDTIVDRMIERYDLPESYRDFAKNQAVNMNKEISVFMHFFGQMNNSSDVLLNLTSSLVEEMQGKSTEAKQKLFREFADKMDKAGVSAKDMQEFAKDGYIYNMYDFKKFNEKKLDTERIAYSIAKGKIEVADHFTLEEYLELKGDSFYPDMTIEEFNIYQDEYEKRRKTEKESANDESYYEALKEKHTILGISKETQKFLNTLSYERGRVQRKVMDENNRPIYTEKEKSLLESYAASRTETKQMYSEMGVLKQGIIEHTRPPLPMEELNKTFFEKNGLYYTLSDDAGTEARISFDLHKLDADYNNSGDKSTDFEAFVKTGIRIQEEEGLSKAIDFYKNNLGIVFTDKFWSQSEGNSLDEYGDHEAVYEIRRLQNRLSDLKKQNKNHQNAAEIEGHNMTITAQEKVQQLSRDLELAYEKLPKLKDKKQQNNNYKISANASYYKLLKIKGIEKNTEEEFIEMRKHMTPRNFERAGSLWFLANNLDKGGKVTSKKQAERLEEVKKEHGFTTNREAALHLNRQKLLPYFKRVTPQNYITIEEIVDKARKEGKSDLFILEQIDEKLTSMFLDENFEFNVHYTFKEQESKAINPNYDPEFKGGIEQPKLSEYKNEEFFQEFGMVEVKKGDRITYEPTRNLKKYETIQEVYKLKQSLFDMMNVSNAENMYKLPQMSKTNTNKLFDLLTKGDKKSTIGEMFKDFTEYRVDDMEYGAKDDLVSSGTKVIPKLYVKDLENASDVSDDLFYSLLAMTEQASLYKARKEGLSDVLAIEDKMLSRNSPTNKASDSTSNYKMFKSFMDYNYFGVKESMQYKRNIPGLGERDLTKLFRLFHKYIRVRNLGFNAVVPLTSWLTGEANWVIEKKIGEYVSKDSANMAKSEFYGKLAKDAMKSDNSLGYNDKSKWNVLGEFLDVFDMSQKAENAKYGKGVRLLGNLSMVSHQVGNFPIIPKVVLATIMDYRVIKGAIVSKTKFDRDNSTLSRSEKEAEWRKYSDKTLYSFLDIKPTGVIYKPELLEQLDKGQEYVDSKMLGIRNVIKDRLQKIDGQIPESQKLAAQRHALLTFLTTHKGWLSINLQRRFKGTQWNIENNQLEQGSYTTLGSLLSETASNMRNYNEGLIKSLKKAYNNPKSANKIFQTEDLTQEQLDQASDLVKRNMRRLGLDLAAIGIISLLATMVSAAADDEVLKDMPGMQLTNLLMLRLLNEMASTQTGIVFQTYETTKVPIVGMSQIVDGFLDIPDLFNTDKVESGKYGGYSKQYRYLFKNIPGLKSMHDLREIEKTIETYKYYNNQNINIGSLYQYTLWDKIIND